MFFAVFIFAFITGHVAMEIPSYIHVCGRRDSNIDQCIINSVENLKDKICHGFPELNIQPIDPFILEHLTILDTSNMKLYWNDSEITGLCDFVINSFHINMDTLRFDIEALFKQLHINGTYDINLHIIVPVSSKAQAYIITDNVEAKASITIKLVTKNNKKYPFLSELKLKLDIKKFDIKFSDEVKVDQAVEIARNFIANNQQEILRIFIPALEKTISKRILSMANDIVKNYTYEELLPDRT